MQAKQCVVNEFEIARGIYDLPPIEEWDVGANDDFDIIICPLGFEERTSSIIQKLADKCPATPRAATHGFLATYSTNLPDNDKNSEVIRGSLNQLCSEIHTIDADSPQHVFNSITAVIDGLLLRKTHLNVAFDISGASGTLIMSTIKALMDRAENLSITIFYTEALEYYPNWIAYKSNPELVIKGCCAIGDPEADHEYGVELVDVNELYPGYSIENRRELVIAVPSFRTERLRQCLQFVSEQILSSPGQYINWLFGVPPATKNAWRNTLQKQMVDRFVAMTLGNETELEVPSTSFLNTSNSCDVSTLDYREMTRVLLEIADANLGREISVLHMGSKMQALGLSLALQARGEITVFYARPTRFKPDRYSMGVGDAHCVRIECPDKVLKQLRKVGTLEFCPAVETDRSGRPEA